MKTTFTIKTAKNSGFVFRPLLFECSNIILYSYLKDVLFGFY